VNQPSICPICAAFGLGPFPHPLANAFAAGALVGLGVRLALCPHHGGRVLPSSDAPEDRDTPKRLAPIK
jgi:hypothetical protein